MGCPGLQRLRLRLHNIRSCTGLQMPWPQVTDCAVTHLKNYHLSLSCVDIDLLRPILAASSLPSAPTLGILRFASLVYQYAEELDWKVTIMFVDQ